MIQETPQSGADPSKQVFQVPDVALSVPSCNTSIAGALTLQEIEDAGLKLYDATVDPIYRFFSRKTRNKEEANDLTAETIKRMLEGLKNKTWYEPPSVSFAFKNGGLARDKMAQNYLHWLQAKKDLKSLAP